MKAHDKKCLWIYITESMKYIVVTGGVASGLGKGITISSIGRVLKNCGLNVTSIKVDPYLNIDAGTMSPFEHGEVFVLDDGGEVDLDLGNYERFLDLKLSRDHNITTGKIYQSIIRKERDGEYLGKTIQIVPHVTNEIQDWIERVSHIPVDIKSNQTPDVCLIELGGTVGDMESSVFLEAIRQLRFRVGPREMCVVHVTLVPSLGEQKTKPTQHTIKELRSSGLHPDILCCRGKEVLWDSTRSKISSFCQIPSCKILSVHDVSNIYMVPMILSDQNIHGIINDQLGFDGYFVNPPDMSQWGILARGAENFSSQVKIAIVGKYTGLEDSYHSVVKALKHSSIRARVSLQVLWIDASDLEKSSLSPKTWENLERADGVVIPGGFGTRGSEGKILVARWARQNKKPLLGVCMGFQCMVIEHCRTVLGWKEANSTECDEGTPHPVVVHLKEVEKRATGGTMRLGSHRTILRPFSDGEVSISSRLYGGSSEIEERHRHRYEVNPYKVDEIESSGLKFVGRDETGQRMEIAEIHRSKHPFYVGTQFHPEFTSKPTAPSPLFLGLILASNGQSLIE